MACSLLSPLPVISVEHVGTVPSIGCSKVPSFTSSKPASIFAWYGSLVRHPPLLPHERREQIDAKDHWTSVTPDYLTKEFSKARDAAHAYDHVPAGERPTFHEIRALGAWLYEQQNFPMDYIQALMATRTRR
jgi:hypothetical protein